MVDWCEGKMILLYTIVGGVILISSSIMLGLSFSIVNEDEYGLRFNLATGKFSDTVDEMGRHFVSLGRKHFRYPRRYVTIEFKKGGHFPYLSAWTNSGQNIYLEISVDIRLVKDKLLNFFYDYGEEWLAFIHRIIFATIKDTSTSFSSEKFFEERATIQTSFFNKVFETLSNQTSGAIELMNLQLRKITLDTSYEAAIEDKLIVEQTNNVLNTNKLIREVEADIEIVQKSTDNTIREELSVSRANATNIRGEGWGDYIKSIYSNEITCFNNIIGKVESPKEDFFISYIYLNYLRRLSLATKLYLGLGNFSFDHIMPS